MPTHQIQQRRNARVSCGAGVSTQYCKMVAQCRHLMPVFRDGVVPAPPNEGQAKITHSILLGPYLAICLLAGYICVPANFGSLLGATSRPTRLRILLIHELLTKSREAYDASRTNQPEALYSNLCLLWKLH